MFARVALRSCSQSRALAMSRGSRMPLARSMSVITDPHEILGVRRGASSQEIKVAYRSLAMQSHPDRNTGRADAEAHFKAVNEVRCLASPCISEP